MAAVFWPVIGFIWGALTFSFAYNHGWKKGMAAIKRFCGIRRRHDRHFYYGPSPVPGETKQVQYVCEGF